MHPQRCHCLCPTICPYAPKNSFPQAASAPYTAHHQKYNYATEWWPNFLCAFLEKNACMPRVQHFASEMPTSYGMFSHATCSLVLDTCKQSRSLPLPKHNLFAPASAQTRGLPPCQLGKKGGGKHQKWDATQIKVPAVVCVTTSHALGRVGGQRTPAVRASTNPEPTTDRHGSACLVAPWHA